ncbi:MAG TPA: hypothetical protein DGB72_01810 [Gemmatimonadetes bacterium]|jgi:hypothetical protein|nr:hypothetical protein [Chloroflexota bacterium]HAF20686.1 hypothetical protein [Chloroflexota bacterium]HCU10840.1 hypothetical protein [Gemmatimonadota bacterium]
MTEHATPDFRRRFAALPHAVRDTLVIIAKSSLADAVSKDQHEQLLLASIAAVDAGHGEEVRIEMGWCLERMDDFPTCEWVASQT